MTMNKSHTRACRLTLGLALSFGTPACTLITDVDRESIPEPPQPPPFPLVDAGVADTGVTPSPDAGPADAGGRQDAGSPDAADDN
jgi:hypothetical protein